MRALKVARRIGLSARFGPRVQQRCISPYRRLAHCAQQENARVMEEKLQEGLGDGQKSPRIDHQAKRIITSAGELPLSPLFDRDWLAKRQKITKKPAGKVSGRFRKKVYNNPYVQALASPLRRCNKTHVTLPRSFLQDMEIVQHPTTGDSWWAPGPLSFAGLNLRMDTRLEKRDEAPRTKDAQDRTTEASGETTSFKTADSSKPEDVMRQRPDYSHGQPTRAHVAAFLLSSQAVLRKLNPRYPIIDERVDQIKGQIKYSSDTPDLILRTMRQHVVDALVCRSAFGGLNRQRWVVPCEDWDAIKDVRVRGCVLWLPRPGQPSQAAWKPYATLDVDAQFGSKLAVYNLRWLLGEGELARLRSSSEVYEKNDILVLTQMPEKWVMRLHLLLWRLQGYLAT